jgi:predicted  nucleic acid-binding Zn-ribbon protein
MADEPDNIILVYLRRLDEKVDRLADDMREVKQRLGILEQQYAVLSARIDRLDQRVERIERRLDLIPIS